MVRIRFLPHQRRLPIFLGQRLQILPSKDHFPRLGPRLRARQSRLRRGAELDNSDHWTCHYWFGSGGYRNWNLHHPCLRYGTTGATDVYWLRWSFVRRGLCPWTLDRRCLFG